MQEPLVLIVEDDDRFAQLLQTYLETAGFRTVRARDGEEGLRLARDVKPNAITLDVVMPNMNGWTFLDVIVQDELLNCLPIILISSSSDLGYGLSLGAAAVLQKPLHRDALLDALARCSLHATKGTERVLVIDDDPKAMDLITLTLEGVGYRVDRAYGGQQALEHMQAVRPDLILLDLIMPEIDGFAVIEHLKNNPELMDIPVIVLTAKLVTREERERLNGYVVTVAQKSHFNKPSFLREVTRAVRRESGAPPPD